MSYFDQPQYEVTDGNIVYARDLNNPLIELDTGIQSLVSDIQTGANINYVSDTGVADAYAVSLDPAPTAYEEGLNVWLKPSATNTGASTIDVNSLGAISIKRHGLNDLGVGDITANYFVHLKYSNGAFQVVSSNGRAEVAADEAEANAVLTAADVVTTNADAVITNADVITTNADAVQTGLDRTATAADVVTTNADVVLADESESNAAQSYADTLAIYGDTTDVQNAVNTSTSNAALTAADVITTNADVVITNADVVTTNADVLSCAASAEIAHASANASPYVNTTSYVYPTAVIGSNGATYRCVSSTSIVGDDPVTSLTGKWLQLTTVPYIPEFISFSSLFSGGFN